MATYHKLLVDVVVDVDVLGDAVLGHAQLRRGVGALTATGIAALQTQILEVIDALRRRQLRVSILNWCVRFPFLSFVAVQ